MSNIIQEDHIYVNLDVVNNDTLNLSNPLPLNFTESRDNPIFYNPRDYHASIVRFYVETPTLPLFIPSIQSGSVNTTIYSFTMQYLNFSFTSDVVWIPQDNSLPIPSFYSPTNKYYWCYSTNYFVDLLNSALNACYVGLNTAITAGGGVPLSSSLPPFLELDTSSGVIVLYGDKSVFDSSLASPYKLYSNVNTMENLFASALPFKYNGLSNPNLSYQYLFIDNNNLNTFLQGNVSYLQMISEYPVVGLWSPVKTIIFTTSQLPINYTQVGKLQSFSQAGSFQTTSNSNETSLIITDYEVQNENGFQYKPSIIYFPTAEYRLVSLLGTQPVYNIQLACFWKDKFNNYFPLEIAHGSCANLKLLFRARS